MTDAPAPGRRDEAAAAKAARPSLAALKPLIPYAARHRGRILLALAALTLASAATLTVPLAVLPERASSRASAIGCDVGSDPHAATSTADALAIRAVFILVSPWRRWEMMRRPSGRTSIPDCLIKKVN